MSAGWLVLAFFIVCLLTGVPICIALGVAAAGTLLVTDFLPMQYVVTTLFNAGDSFPLLAIPFFVFSGEVMGKGGISRRLINWAKTLLCALKGSLGLITVFVCGIFAAISGSAPATVAAVGSIMIPEMEKDGYDGSYAATLTAVSGGLGPLIPPSLIMVIYGITSGESITTLFLAGLLPGLLLMFLLMVTSYIICKRKGYGQVSDGVKFSFKRLLKETVNSFWALLMPIIILGGIYGGIFTATEAAVVASAYGIIIACFVYREINLKQLFNAFVSCSNTMGAVAIMIGCATVFGRLLTLQQVPQALTNAMLSFSDSKIVLLICINLILLLAGMFLETLSAVMIFTPLFLPIALAYGINPIHFGVIMCVNLVVGQVTPPVGVNLFVAQSVSGVQIERMFKWLVIFLIVMLINLVLVTYIPPISLVFIK